MRGSPHVATCARAMHDRGSHPSRTSIGRRIVAQITIAVLIMRLVALLHALAKPSHPVRLRSFLEERLAASLGPRPLLTTPERAQSQRRSSPDRVPGVWLLRREPHSGSRTSTLILSGLPARRSPGAPTMQPTPTRP